MSDISQLQDDDAIISTSRLTKAFGNLVAVNDLNLRVMRGDVFGFLGPNGSGKTTTIRMLLGLIRPTAGRAILFGMDNQDQLSSILARIGAIVEMPIFYPYLSGLDNLRVIGAASGLASGPANNRRIEEVLELVELRGPAHMAFSKYSLGMKQRLGIAAALLADPELVLLDEPTNGLDPAGVVEIRQLILRLADLGKTIFISSHILHEIQQVCNRVAILQKGNLIKQGNVAELLRRGEQVHVRMKNNQEAEEAQKLLSNARARGADWIANSYLDLDREQHAILRIEAPITRSSEINELLASNQLFAAELRPYEGSLEEIFLELTTTSHGAPGTHPGMVALAGNGPSPSPLEKRGSERV